MSQIIKTTVDGKEVEQEVFTQAELEEKANAKAEEAKAAVEAEKQVEIDRLNEEKAALEEAASDKDKNWAELRKKADSKGGDTSELKKQMDTITQRLEEIGQQPIKSAKDTFVSNNLPEDKDKREKFDYYYKKLSEGMTKPEEHKKAMEEALALVLPGQKPNLDYQLSGTRISSDFGKPANTGERSETNKAFSKAFGLSEEDHKKYGKNN
jgi:hypothetical protein